MSQFHRKFFYDFFIGIHRFEKDNWDIIGIEKDTFYYTIR